MLESYDKYQKLWHQQSHVMQQLRTKRLVDAIGISGWSRKINKEQAERDLTLLERFELFQEKVNNQEVLGLAVNPNELQFGNSHFMWTLRNNFHSELQAQGHAENAIHK